MYANLKGSKNNKPSQISDFALACKILKDLWGTKKMSETFNVSTTQLREIYKIDEARD